MNLTQCDFKPCQYQFDGNCTKPTEYQKCEYISAVQMLEAIIGSQKFCVLCKNRLCKNATTPVTCIPIWNGLRIEK